VREGFGVMLPFKDSQPLTLGVELELQLVNMRDYNLTRAASDLLAAVAKSKPPGEIKPEITESMIEICTAVCEGHAQVLAELEAMRTVVVAAADKLNIGIAGGGTHPFQKWSERRIYDTPRFKRVSELYGYLAKTFTVFGQHIHIGVRSGDEAVRLVHALARYVPHFIALSASSPFSLSTDTQFDSSRLNVINAFPLAGSMPFVRDWEEFGEYFSSMQGYGIVQSMKDFYWDVRPKPEYGTIEVRVCDTPLTVARAAELAAYAQALAASLRDDTAWTPHPNLYLVYNYNRFQACRFGFAAMIVDPIARSHVALGDEIVATLQRLMPYAERLGGSGALGQLLKAAIARSNDARELREVLEKRGSLADVVRVACDRWMRG
jgi:glutamate---cysteine ligase / carboxylate-amine ligase